MVTGTCFAEMGVKVTCVDVNKEKIEGLKRGVIPIFEPGLEELVQKNAESGRLQFATDLASAIDGVELIFSAVGTPPDEDGSADLKYVLEVARTVGQNMTGYHVLVTKSTVPVGTAEKVRAAIKEEQLLRGVEIPFDVASNPEFLKEGAAIRDFMAPDRVVVGVDSDRARKKLRKLYKPFTLNDYPVIFMDITSAEMTKYAANAMLATRISFMNEVANLCERVGANVDMVRRGIGTDKRIGPHFLYAGCGYGGSCFPKDVKALYRTGLEYGVTMQVIEAVERVNYLQKEVLFHKLATIWNGDFAGKKVALWGLSFKPDTDDIREATAFRLIEMILEAGAEVSVHDPVAMEISKPILGDRVTFAADMYEALIDADAMLLVTEWKQYRLPSWDIVKRCMRNLLIIDGRNIFDSSELAEKQISYLRIGK